MVDLWGFRALFSGFPVIIFARARLVCLLLAVIASAALGPWCNRGIARLVFRRGGTYSLYFFGILVVYYIMIEIMVPLFSSANTFTRIILRLFAMPVIVEAACAVTRLLFFAWGHHSLPASLLALIIFPPIMTGAIAGRCVSSFVG